MKTNLSEYENKVLNYLNSHTGLTTRQSVTELHIMNVQDVIMRLKDYGYNIQKDWHKTKTNKRFAVYSLQTII